ncbi:MAG: MobA/MobL family protein, partial [Selenomonadaceae bacterium]|nr:MobA/MobL family protein [Selenomonadaceae bacterium]
QESYQDKNVRFDFSDERKNLAKWTADTILQRIDESQNYVSAHSHVEYINRENAFAHRGGCIFHSHKLPKWAKDDPKNFFKAADRYEGVGNRRYVEIEFALPNELKTVEQFRQIIEPFIEKHLKDHYYAYAIHDKFGELSNQRHPHVHIMFSERLIDDVEKIKERSACNFFKYPARKKKDGSEPTFEEKFKRGSQRDRKWGDHSYVAELRADCAKIQNEVLEKNGFSIRVDHRTLKAQKEEAERNGDTFLARLFNRIPEKYIGIISCKENDDPQLAKLREFRQLRQKHYDLILKTDSLTKEAEELETKDAVQISSTKAKKLIDSEQFLHSSPNSFQDLKSKMFSAIAEVNNWKRAIISRHDAEEQAKMEYLTKAERTLRQNYFETLAQQKHLEEFLNSLKKPDDSQKDAFKAYDDVFSGVKKKVFALKMSAILMKKSVEKIDQKLETPDCKKNILMVTHKILQNNLHARKMLKLASQNLEKAVDELHDKLFAQTISEEPKNIFKTREVYDILRRHLSTLKKEYEKTLDKKFELQSKIISPQRATEMAKNIFVHGGFKKLRFDIRKLKKDEEKFSKNLRAFSFRQKLFQEKDWSAEERPIFLQEKYFLIKQKTLLELEQNRLKNLKISLDNRQTELDSLCQQSDSQKKIELIAAGILRKNFNFVRQHDKVETRRKNLHHRISHLKSQVDTLHTILSHEKRPIHYKVVDPEKLPDQSKISLVSTIANAILREPDAVQLVAYCPDNCLEMEKDWDLMTDLDKEEILQKKIYREL